MVTASAPNCCPSGSALTTGGTRSLTATLFRPNHMTRPSGPLPTALRSPCVLSVAERLTGRAVLQLASIAEPVMRLRIAQRRVQSGELEADVVVDDVGEIGLVQH